MDFEAKMRQAEKLVQARRLIVANLVIPLQGEDTEVFIKAVISCFEAFDIEISLAEIASNRAKWEKLHQMWCDSSLPKVVSDVELKTGRGYANFIVYTIRNDSSVTFNITAGPCSNPNPAMYIHESKRVLFPGFFIRFSKDIAGLNSNIKFTVNNQGGYMITKQQY
ncbi:hypothetical protein AUK04_02635 [Candidatus Roizmanbacteria bacterium CG2_30_33_16]|uniref:Uncharacterized protein n=1 Tax=Candidatus Roizmanbacteria bacterium CG2_30_33_16 TaxID=1805340 RepID=A0A1J5HTJ7_9BACT|nr:MAG: hypothetical protein AUK04_02635 [Candidatus Roizmanbacteria bacterium CG2_30_33_16]